MARLSNTTEQIRARVDAFVDDLRDLIQQAAIEAVHTALGADTPAARAPRKSKAGSAKPAVARKQQGGKRIRRTRDDLDQMASSLVDYIQANPAAGMSDLVRAMGAEAPVVRGPLNELIAEGKIRKEGEKRGTKYFVGSGKKPRVTSKKKAKKKKK
ncbi:MAG: hypothetical protein ACI841_002255 [Planctomycetota bacterium]|jgi:hypothetical protein